MGIYKDFCPYIYGKTPDCIASKCICINENDFSDNKNVSEKKQVFLKGNQYEKLFIISYFLSNLLL